MTPTERPSFKELYEAQTKKMDDLEKRMGRVEKWIILLFALGLSPKLGGPDASKVVAETIKTWML